MSSLWEMSWRYDPAVAALADRHYSRLRPGTPGFVGSGRPLVLRTLDKRAGWVSFWQPTPTHRWKNCWTNSLFRNEGNNKASVLIKHAVAITRYAWGEPPSDGFISFVDPRKVRTKSTPGHCYVIAGWRKAGETDSGLICMQLKPENFPPEMKPFSLQQEWDFSCL